jgi:hypothetical protein
MVEPTVTEFIQSPHDIRRGLLAAMVLNHMADHVALEGFPSSDRYSMDCLVKKIRDSMLTTCPEFKFIQDIADATKHAKLSIPRNQNKPTREVSSSNQISVSPGLFQAPFGEGVFLEAVVVFATLQDGSSKPLLPAVEAVLKAWRSKL